MLHENFDQIVFDDFKIQTFKNLSNSKHNFLTNLLVVYSRIMSLLRVDIVSFINWQV